MSFGVLIRPEAERDLTEARAWYEERAGLGATFTRRVSETLERIRRNPENHAECYRGVRRTLVRRFPYVIYYQVIGQEVWILAVLHGHRDPRIWRSRLRS